MRLGSRPAGRRGIHMHVSQVCEKDCLVFEIAGLMGLGSVCCLASSISYASKSPSFTGVCRHHGSQPNQLRVMLQLLLYTDRVLRLYA